MTCRKCGFEQKTIFFRGREVGDNFIWKIRSARGQRIFLILFTPLITFRPTKCPPFLRGEVIILRFGVRGHKDAVCFKCFSFSGRGRVTSCSGEFREILCGFCQQTALSPFSTEKIQQKQKSCKSLWHKGFYAEIKKSESEVWLGRRNRNGVDDFVPAPCPHSREFKSFFNKYN